MSSTPGICSHTIPPGPPRTGWSIASHADWDTPRGPRAGDYRLDRKRIYILPSRAGLLFAGAMATMLLATDQLFARRSATS